MINLMPPDIKDQIRYAKLNRLVLRYVKVTVLVAGVLAGIFAWAFYSINQNAIATDNDVAEKQAEIAKLNNQFTPVAKQASDRLAAIKFVLGSQTRFSALIDDIAKQVPQGVSIDSMTLTGDDAAPVRIAITAQSYNAALSFRNALTLSPRVANADLENISQTSSGAYSAAVVVGFKPGQAR